VCQLHMCYAPCCMAQAADPESILIRNVRLIDRNGKTEDQIVNVLIKKTKLDIVTKDNIPAAQAVLVVDAKNGVLLGNLEIGQPSSFMILDQDPREDFTALLDTNTHTQFAMHEGQIIRNNLMPVTDSVSETPKKSGWFAYSPPPVALPVSYQSTKKWNKWESKYVNGMFFSAVLLDRMRWVSQDEGSKQQVGRLGSYDGGEVRGLRAGVGGTLNFEKPWIYTVGGATSAFDKGFESNDLDDFTLFDWRVDIPMTEDVSLSLGKQKEPISMERSIGLIYLPWQERSSVSDGMLPSRNVGAVLSGTALERRMSWAGGVFNDWFDTNKAFNESASQIIGRLTGLPFISEDESNLVHLGVGLRHTNANEGVRYHARPEFNKAPRYVDTDMMTQIDRAITSNLEASWRLGSFWLSGEYTRTDVQAAQYGDPVFDGYHVSLSYVLTGEMRPYNRRSGVLGPVPIANSVKDGGWGTWETAIRWSSLDLTDGNITGDEMDILSLGLNWWLSQTFNFNVNYRHIALDQQGTKGNSDGIMFRAAILME
jgi:phosphate-selective porin OprO/OprP